MRGSANTITKNSMNRSGVVLRTQFHIRAIMHNIKKSSIRATLFVHRELLRRLVFGALPRGVWRACCDLFVGEVALVFSFGCTIIMVWWWCMVAMHASLLLVELA